MSYVGVFLWIEINKILLYSSCICTVLAYSVIVCCIMVQFITELLCNGLSLVNDVPSWNLVFFALHDQNLLAGSIFLIFWLCIYFLSRCIYSFPCCVCMYVYIHAHTAWKDCSNTPDVAWETLKIGLSQYSARTSSSLLTHLLLNYIELVCEQETELYIYIYINKKFISVKPTSRCFICYSSCVFKGIITFYSRKIHFCC